MQESDDNAGLGLFNMPQEVVAKIMGPGSEVQSRSDRFGGVDIGPDQCDRGMRQPRRRSRWVEWAAIATGDDNASLAWERGAVGVYSRR